MAKQTAPSLAELQDLFQRAVLKGDATILSEICDNSRTSRDVLLGVYQRAYASRLVEILESDYEYLLAYMGAEAFETMAVGYIRQYPSDNPNARWFARSVPQFLSDESPYRERPELADLARLEFSLGIAFDAEDAAVLTMGELAAFPIEDWARLVFTPHPAAQLITCTTDCMALWTAMKEAATAPENLGLEGEDGQHILIWREGTMPKLRVVTAEEAMMWQEACRGMTFGALCEMVATFGDADSAALRAAQYLQSWISSGALSAARLAGD